MGNDETGQVASNSRNYWLPVLVTLQIGMLIAINTLDYAYLFPSQSGLTLGHFILFCLIYAVSLVVGIGIAINTKQWRYVGLQFLIPVGCSIILVISSFFDPRNQNLDPSNYQNLVGKTRGEIEPLLHKFGTSGMSSNLKTETAHYNGMDLRYEKSSEKSPRDDRRDVLIEVTKGQPK